jgi:AcrR family transcriptional regulator
MSERREQILRVAIGIIEDEGYGSLGMRALARASGIKHGAMRYHFRTWEDLLRALVDYIAAEIGSRFSQNFDANGSDSQSPSVRDIAEFMLDDTSGDPLLSDRLWPQLWAMQQVEPLVSDLLEDVYAEYLKLLEQALVQAGAVSPHAEALWLASLLEGESLFTGIGRRWSGDRELVRNSILAMIDERYGSPPSR